MTRDGTRLVPSRVTGKEEPSPLSHAHGLGTRPGLEPCVWVSGACDHPVAHTACTQAVSPSRGASRGASPMLVHVFNFVLNVIQAQYPICNAQVSS